MNKVWDKYFKPALIRGSIRTVACLVVGCIGLLCGVQDPKWIVGIMVVAGGGAEYIYSKYIRKVNA